MAESKKQNTNEDKTAAAAKEMAVLVSGSTGSGPPFKPTVQAHGSGPRFRPKPGSVFPARKRLVKMMMVKAFLRMIRGGCASAPPGGNGISDRRAPRVYPDDSPPIEAPNGQN